jgi:hypothetical protein
VKIHETYEEWLEHFTDWMVKETQMDRAWCRQWLDTFPLRVAYDRYKENLDFYINQLLPTLGGNRE